MVKRLHPQPVTRQQQGGASPHRRAQRRTFRPVVATQSGPHAAISLQISLRCHLCVRKRVAKRFQLTAQVTGNYRFHAVEGSAPNAFIFGQHRLCPTAEVNNRQPPDDPDQCRARSTRRSHPAHDAQSRRSSAAPVLDRRVFELSTWKMPAMPHMLRGYLVQTGHAVSHFVDIAQSFDKCTVWSAAGLRSCPTLFRRNQNRHRLLVAAQQPRLQRCQLDLQSAEPLVVPFTTVDS